MFDRCNSLTSLKILGNISNIISYSNIFYGISTNGTLTVNCAYEDKWNEILITNQSKSKFPSTWTIECETVTE